MEAACQPIRPINGISGQRKPAVLKPKSPVFANKIYTGRRRKDGTCEVWVTDAEDKHQLGSAPLACRPLPLRTDVRNHSPTGFAWGYGGSGPAQLALALLLDALGDEQLALQYYQDFKWKCVVRWNYSWRITAQQIRAFVASQQQANVRLRSQTADS